MSQLRQKHHITSINIIGFVGTSFFGILGSFLPEASVIQVISWQVSGAMFIAACTLTSFKLAREYWDIPAAGFVMLAIAYGVFYSEIAHLAKGEGILTFSAGVYLFIPAMFMIAYYGGFPVWLKLLGLAACIPFSIILIRSYEAKETFIADKILFVTSYASIQMTACFWAYYFWKQDKQARQFQKDNEITKN